MDKYEYKVRSEEIKDLIKKKKYTEAMKIADTIDWRRVKSINMLCTISDLYKMNRRYEESREILLLAYERHPGSRMIIYSLCELSIKLDDVVQAVEYYKEFVQTAPRDNGKYVLQYKLYEAQEVTLEERIAVLEELKSREYREKWAYELAYLYHRIGLSTKCVEECDELILWFGEGKYVTKAMELKMLHAPLTDEQQKKYKKARGKAAVDPVSGKKEEEEDTEMLVKPVNVGKYATINLQKELAESMREVLAEEENDSASYAALKESADGLADDPTMDLGTRTDEIINFEEESEPDDLEAYEEEEISLDGPGDFTREIISNLLENTGEIREIRPQEETLTAAESESFAAGESVSEAASAGQTSEMEEPAEESESFTAGESVSDAASAGQTSEMEEPAEESESFTAGESVSDAVSAGQTSEMEEPAEESESFTAGESVSDAVSAGQTSEMEEPAEESESFTVGESVSDAASAGQTSEMKESAEEPDAEEIYFEDTDTLELTPVKHEDNKKAVIREGEESRVVKMSNTGDIPKIVQNIRPSAIMPSAESIANVKNGELDNLLSQDYDGQISLAVSEKNPVEKQITGQMSIGDILIEWEKMKKENEEKRAEAVRKRVKEQTGEIFSRFDASTKQGLLAGLDALAEESVRKEKTGLTDEEERKLAENAALEESDDASAGAGALAEESGQDSESAGSLEKTEKSAGNSTDDGAQADEETAEDAAVAEREERQRLPQRQMTAEEKKLFGPFIQTKTTKNQILDTLDHISLASYTGNVILTGEFGMDTVKLAKNIIKDIQMTDNNFSGRMAKITGQALNRKDMEKTFQKLGNGALIIEGAGNLKEAAVKSMTKLLEREKQGIIVILEDTKINMNRLLDNYKTLHRNFNLRIDVEALDNDSLVLFAKKYAFEREYVIDELGVLALYTRISELQTSEHSVTTKEVKEIVEEAIYHADRKNLTHFMDILVGKRYDDEDMIILREKDFV